MRKIHRRVVVTGIGVVTCLSSDIGVFWQSLLEGRSGIRRITSFDASEYPCQIAGEVQDFDPTEYVSPKLCRRISRASQMALVSAEKAIQDAGLPNPIPEPERVGVYHGTAVGGFEKAEAAMVTLQKHGLGRVNPFALPSAMLNMPAFHITQRLGAKGPSATFSTACATGTQSVGEAAAAIRLGRADVILAGGVEALIRYYTIGGFSVLRILPTSYNHDPERAARPFDALREGFVLSEGAACLVLESLEHATARGAKIYAEVAGFSSSNDGHHVASLDPAAEGPVRAMAWALQDADVASKQVDYINAHGTGTVTNDAVETLAIKKLFGDRAYQIPISSTKSMIGHAMGASGAIEAGVCALTIRDGKIHPTINYENEDPECDLDYVPDGVREFDVKVALSNSFGLGSQSACLVLKKLEP
jgi:beta-ketoacyl-acyl-carrier-protein synthase II